MRNGQDADDQPDKDMQAPSVRAAEAATAFLALQFAYMVGAYALEQPLHPVGADHFVLINIGIPVAVRDDKRAFTEFSRLVTAAYALAPKVRSLIGIGALGASCGWFGNDPEVICRKPAENGAFSQIQIASHF